MLIYPTQRQRVSRFPFSATLFILLTTVASIAQEKPFAEVTGSFQLDHLTLSGGGASVSTYIPLGWDGSVNFPILSWFGIAGDVGRVWITNSEQLNVSGTTLPTSATASLYTFGGGPQFTYRNRHVQPFARFILGDAHSSGAASVNSTFGSFSGSSSVNSFFIALGGGADFRITHHVWLRGAADYFRTSKDGATVNGIRAFAGITFTFGKRGLAEP